MVDDESKELCAIITPFGLCQFNQLSLGVKLPPDVAQETISLSVGDLNVDAYMDDCGHFTNKAFEHHDELFDKLLSVLAANGMKFNPVKFA